MSKRMPGWGLCACLLIGGCGGAGGGSTGLGPGGFGSLGLGGDTPTPAPTPQPPVPVAQAIAGTWREPLIVATPSVLTVRSDGLAYGLLSSNSGIEVVRGRLMGLDGEVQTAPFDAINVATGQTRPVGLAGQYQAGGQLRLSLVPDDGSEIVAGYVPFYDQPTPVADLMGTYGAFIAIPGRSGAYTLTLDDQGTVQMTSTQPGEAHCQASGALSEREPSSAQMDVVLEFSGDGCQLPTGTRIEGFALFDHGDALLEAFGMNEAGTVGLFMHAPRQ